MKCLQVLNGGDKIGPVEREDAERAFIRFELFIQMSCQHLDFHKVLPQHHSIPTLPITNPCLQAFPGHPGTRETLKV